MNNYMIYDQGTKHISLSLYGANSNYYSWNSNSITLLRTDRGTTGYNAFLYSTNKIDVTKYKKLYVKGNFRILTGSGYTSNFGFGLSSSTQDGSDLAYVGNYWFRNAVSTSTNVTNATFYVDISSLSGSYYLRMKTYNSNIITSQIWLSPE